MKFVFDVKTQQYVPENFLNRLDADPLEIQVFRWLDDNPGIPKSYSYSTRQIAFEFFRQFPNADCTRLDAVRDADAKLYNEHHELAETAFTSYTTKFSTECTTVQTAR